MPPEPISAPIDPEVPAPLSMGAVLKISALRKLWFAQVVSVLGDFLALFAIIGVLTFQFHARPEQVTAIQIAYLLPIALLGVVVGVFADRWPMKTTLVASDAIRACLVLLLPFASRLWHFYTVLAAISVGSSFFAPAQGIAIRSAVPMHGLRSANALMQQVMFGMRIVGPALAAFLVSSFGAVSCYLLDAVSFAGSALLILSAPLRRVEATAKVSTATGTPGARSGLNGFWKDMKKGVEFIVHHPGLLFVILALISGMFVLGCFGPLIAVYVRDDLRASTQIFGVASAMIGVGMLIGINVLNTIAKNVANSVLVYSGLAGIAVGLAGLAGVPTVVAACSSNFVVGFSTAAILVPAQTMIQQESPPALLGRIGSTVMSAIFTAQISGLILSGILVEHLGIRQVFSGCAILVLLLIVVGRLWMEPKTLPAAA